MKLFENLYLKRLSYNSTANYQKRYESLFNKDALKTPFFIVRKSQNITEKQFNINTDNSDVISVTYFENHNVQADENTPIIIYFYGNSLSNKYPVHYHNFCSHLAQNSNSIVIMVNYLQPPKYKFPTAHNNAIKAIKWVKEICPYWQISSDKIYVAGDMLGANIALSAVINIKKEMVNYNLAGILLTDPGFL